MEKGTVKRKEQGVEHQLWYFLEDKLVQKRVKVDVEATARWVAKAKRVCVLVKNGTGKSLCIMMPSGEKRAV